jgi:hypothetical protein
VPDKGSTQPDDYPLAPASGPALQGDIRAQPTPAAVLLPLSGSNFALVPTLMTTSARAAESGTRAEAALAAAVEGRQILTDRLSLLSLGNAVGKPAQPLNAVAAAGTASADTRSETGEVLLRASARPPQEPELPAGPRADGQSGAWLSTNSPSPGPVPAASAWVASVETRIAETPDPPYTPVAAGRDAKALPAGNIRPGDATPTAGFVASQPARPGLLSPGNVRRLLVVLLFASGVSAAWECRHAVHKALRKVVRGPRSDQL